LSVEIHNQNCHTKKNNIDSLCVCIGLPHLLVPYATLSYSMVIWESLVVYLHLRGHHRAADRLKSAYTQLWFMF